jgi:hypothetical protein
MKNVRPSSFSQGLLLLGALSLMAGTASAESVEVSRLPERVLLVGNSLSGGLDVTLEGLAAAGSSPMKLKVETSISGGQVLEGLWEQQARHEQIQGGKYDRVFLQASLSKTGTAYYGGTVDTEEKFHEYAPKFDAEIRKAGAETVLFMHWQFNEPDAMTIEEIARVYGEVARELGVEVAPVGLAWQRAQREMPDLELLSDSVHASATGCYLTACVFYATLFKKSPAGLAYFGWAALPPQRAAFLQRVAGETVRDYRQAPKGR